MVTVLPIRNGTSTFSWKTFGSIQPPPPAFVSHCTQTAYWPDSSARSELRNVLKASAPGYTRLKYLFLSVKKYQLATAFAEVKSLRGMKPSSGRYPDPARVKCPV